MRRDYYLPPEETEEERYARMIQWEQRILKGFMVIVLGLATVIALVNL